MQSSAFICTCVVDLVEVGLAYNTTTQNEYIRKKSNYNGHEDLTVVIP